MRVDLRLRISCDHTDEMAAQANMQPVTENGSVCLSRHPETLGWLPVAALP